MQVRLEQLEGQNLALIYTKFLEADVFCQTLHLENCSVKQS